VLESFDCFEDAVKCIGGGSSSGIGNVLNKRAKSHKGFYWRYQGSDKLPQYASEDTPRLVEKICL